MKRVATSIPGTTPPRSWKELNRTDYILLSICATLTIISILYYFLSDDSRTWRWDRLMPYIFYEDNDGNLAIGMLAKGFIMTIRLGLWVLIVALIFGLSVGMYTANKRGLAVLPFTFFVQTLRNIPPLIFLFLVYFFSGQFLNDFVFTLQDFSYSLSPEGQEILSYIFAPPMQMEGMLSVIIALGLYEGVYISEIVRSSVESIPKAQTEAAHSLGFNKLQTLWYVLLPQANRIMLPPLAGQTISVFKNSALAALVSLPELTFQSIEVMAVTRLTFEVWIVCMISYFFISRCCTFIFTALENRIKWKPLQ